MATSKWLVTAFILLQAIMFSLAFWGHQPDDSIEESTSISVLQSVSKASSSVFLNNLAILMLPVCKACLWVLGRTLGHVVKLEDGLGVHGMIAWTMTAFAFVHAVSRWVIFAQITHQPALGIREFALVNFSTGVGWSGHAMLLILSLKLTSASFSKKRPKLRTFSQCRSLLFAPFFILGAAHGAFRVPNLSLSAFTSGSDLFWKLWIAGALVYLIERITMGMRSKQKTQISKVIQHPNDVIEVQFLKAGLKSTAGQHILLCCPHVSVSQNRPYTLTSAPEEDYFSVHIHCNDDFTRKFAASLGCLVKQAVPAKALISSAVVSIEQKASPHLDVDPSIRKALPQVFIDDPFGGISDSVFDYEVAVLVGAGTGVMPFASLLKSIWYRMKNPRQPTCLTKVYFFWICHDFETFEWFRSLLMAIEFQDMDIHIEIYPYLTTPVDDADATKMMINSTVNGQDLVTGLRAPSRYGLPEWTEIFQDIRLLHAPIEVAVFFSGPASLAEELEYECQKGSDPDFLLVWKRYNS